MNGNITPKDAYELNDFTLNFLRQISAPNHSINDLLGLIDKYSLLVDSIPAPHRKKAAKVKNVLDKGHRWNITEELRRKVLCHCEKKFNSEPMVLSYLQLDAFITARRYVEAICSYPLGSAKEQQMFCTYYYAGNWWMNLFLELVQKYPKHLELFNALGEIRH